MCWLYAPDLHQRYDVKRVESKTYLLVHNEISRACSLILAINDELQESYRGNSWFRYKSK